MFKNYIIIAFIFTNLFSQEMPGEPDIAWMTTEYDGPVSISISWDMWWGENGDHWKLIENSNNIFSSIKGEKKILKKEISVAKFAFASVVSIKKISKGEKLSLKNIWVKRPGSGDFLAKDLTKLIGKKAKKKIKKNIKIKKTFL